MKVYSDFSIPAFRHHVTIYYMDLLESKLVSNNFRDEKQRSLLARVKDACPLTDAFIININLISWSPY
jgi:hypothetical protein